MRPTILALALLAAVLGFRSSAHAEIVGLNHVWTVPGAMQTGGGISTFIACTNGNTGSVTVGVEMYGPAGTLVGTAQSITVAPNSTVIFGSGNANGLSVDGNLATGAFSKGQARVYGSTSRGILCSAFLADAVGNPPVSMTSLSVIKKTAQKGD
jgi:hypothetical protein